MDDKLQQTSKNHKVTITGRRSILITGVNDVLSFDANEVLLETVQGILMVRGDELHVSRLSLEKGEVDVDGHVDSLTYSDGNGFVKSGETLFGRLFK